MLDTQKRDDQRSEWLEVMNDSGAFKARCDLLVANRHTADMDDMADVADKVYTRDVFGGDA